MTWEALGAVGEVIGAVAIIASLMYLATQIRTSSKIAKAQSQRELLNTYSFFSPTANDPELSEIVRKGLSDFESLSANEKVRFDSWLHPLINQIEAVFRMYRQDLIEEVSYEGYKGALLSLIVCKGGRQWWESAQNTVEKGFAEEVNLALEVEEIVPWTDLVPYYRYSEDEDSRSAT